MIHFDSEADMELAIFNHITDLEVLPWDTSPHRVLKAERQVRIGEHGIVDIVAHVEDMESGNKWIEVVELKNTKLKPENLSQLARYKNFFRRTDSDVRFTLIGLKTFPSGTDDCFLIQASSWASVYEVSVDFVDGVSFSIVENWIMTKPGQSCSDFIASFTGQKVKE